MDKIQRLCVPAVCASMLGNGWGGEELKQGDQLEATEVVHTEDAGGLD